MASAKTITNPVDLLIESTYTGSDFSISPIAVSKAYSVVISYVLPSVLAAPSNPAEALLFSTSVTVISLLSLSDV